MANLTLNETNDQGTFTYHYNPPSHVVVSKAHDNKSVAAITVVPLNGHPTIHTATDANLHAVKTWSQK